MKLDEYQIPATFVNCSDCRELLLGPLRRT
jgi:hypothetical protein